MSPGTFVSESTTKEVDSWDVNIAKEMAEKISERYNSAPYGFYFSTKSRLETDLDSKVINKSPMYYLGGTILVLDEIKSRNDPNDRILISNMECNKWDRVIENCNSWKITLPLEKGDIVLQV